jgi:SAM-dependent methyltransferase
VLDVISRKVERYYTERFDTYGPTAQGVDWNSEESQTLRLVQLLRVLDRRGRVTLNDYGCGYGAMVPVLEDRGLDVEYCGYDLSTRMVDHARRTYAQRPGVTFVDHEHLLAAADYTVASGIFNVKLDLPETEWETYVLSTIEVIARLSERGFAFNMLTSYSDADRMRADLYYADPKYFFDVCKRYAKNVALLHDYGLYEFTLIVRCDE